MYFVQDNLRPSINITVPADYEDCYNELEYMMWIIMKDIMKRHGEDMIVNPHINKNDLFKIHSESYIIMCEDIPSFEKLSISEICFTTQRPIWDTEDYNIGF
jgi:hypothetical protein